MSEPHPHATKFYDVTYVMTYYSFKISYGVILVAAVAGTINIVKTKRCTQRNISMIALDLNLLLLGIVAFLPSNTPAWLYI